MPRLYYDEDAVYLRSLEAERVELTGPYCEYYSLNRGKNVDPLYNEPTNDPLYGGSSALGTDSISNEAWNFYPDTSIGEEPLIFQVSIEYQESDGRNPTVRPEGFEYEYDAIIGIARNTWECSIEDTSISTRVPNEGDVIYLFNEWWDIVRAGKGGNINDSPEYVGFKLELKKRTKYTPDRKI